MSSAIFYKQWKLAIINSDEKKIDKLRSIIKATVYHFPNALSFIDHLNTITDAEERLILVTPVHLMADLPPDIEQKLHKLYIYGEDDENDVQSFGAICLHLSSSIFAQCVERLIHFRRSHENGPARIFGEDCISRSKNLIKELEDLCDNIDEQISFGIEEKN